jgi:hypothetical protein
LSDNTLNNTAFVQGIADTLELYRRDQQSASPVRTEHNPVLTPLHSRLRRLLDDIPRSEQRQGLSLLELQARLRGRKGGLPHIGELGAALRRLGWQRRRRWSNEDAAFASLWYPKDQC